MVGELALFAAVELARKRALRGEGMIEASQAAADAFGVSYRTVLRLASTAHEGTGHARRAIENEVEASSAAQPEGGRKV